MRRFLYAFIVTLVVVVIMLVSKTERPKELGAPHLIGDICNDGTSECGLRW